MKKFLCLITALCFAAGGLTLTVTAAGGGLTVTARSNTLTTSGDPEHYSVFEANGDRITARGFYKDDYIVRFDVTATAPNVSVDLKSHSDGTYEAEFTAPTTNKFAIIRVVTRSGVSYDYRVDYDGGWYFAEFGISERNGLFTEKHAETDLTLTAQYLAGEEYTDEQVRGTLSRIKKLSDDITNGIDDDYEKARAVTRWVADNIYYDYSARNDGVSLETIALNHVLDKRATVCAGYANLTAALLEAAGIKAVTVIGSALSLNEYEELPTVKHHHEWTAFYYAEESRWVIMDSGWDSGNIYNGVYSEYNTAKKYFDISPSAFAQDHRADGAEHRDYFALTDGENAVTETETIAETVTVASETETVTTAETTTASEITPIAEPAPRADNTYLYIAIIALSAGIIASVIVIVKSKFK